MSRKCGYRYDLQQQQQHNSSLKMADFVDCRNFIKYIPPPNHPNDCQSCPDDLNDEILEWKERMKYIHDDIDWLLRLPANHFWAQVIKDETFSLSYDSFWQFCPRPYDLQSISSQCLPIHNQMKKVMLFLFLRICDDAEMDGFAGSSHTKAIYDNYLIDIPKILDVCSIFCSASEDTKQIISKALFNVFEKQQCYWNDLDIAIETILKTFDAIADKFGLTCDENSPKQLSDYQTSNFTASELDDVVTYLFDTFNSLVSLLSFCGHTSHVFLEKEALLRAAMMIEKYLPLLRSHFQTVLNDRQKKLFIHTKKLCLQFCNLILKNCFFKEPSTIFNDSSLCHQYLDVIRTLLSETKFIMNYEKRFNLSQELNRVDEKIQSELGDVIVYVQQVINSLMPENITAKFVNETEQEGAGASVSSDAIETIVLQVKSMLPDEDDAFLRACVVHFDGDPEKVINHILEGNIPPFLQDIRESISKKEEPTGYFRQATKEENTSTLPGRYYMKSDVLSKEIENEIFNERSNPLRNQRTYLENDYTDSWTNFNEYDDEYDDTYDSQNVGALDADSGDELSDLTSRRSFVKPKVLQALERSEQPSDEEEESDDEEESQSEEVQSEMQQPRSSQYSRPFQGRGRGQRRDEGHRRGSRGRPNGGAMPKSDRIQEGTRGRGLSHSQRGRGRGGYTGKKHNQKSLALKKSSKGMTGM